MPSLTAAPDPIVVQNDYFGTQESNITQNNFSYPGIGLTYLQDKGFDSEVKGSTVVVEKHGDVNIRLRRYMSPGINAESVIYKIPVFSKKCYLVASIFMYKGKGAAITPNDISRVVDFVKDDVVSVYSTHNKIIHTFITIGTYGRFHSQCEAQNGNPIVILCEQLRCNIWKYKIPPVNNACTDEFLAYILPGDYKDEIKTAIYGSGPNDVQAWFDVEGNITIGSLVKKLELNADNNGFACHRAGLEKSLDALFKSNLERPRYAIKEIGTDKIILPNYDIEFKKAKKPLRFTDRLMKIKRAYSIWTTLSRLSFCIALGMPVYKFFNEAGLNDEFSIAQLFDGAMLRQMLAVLFVVAFTLFRSYVNKKRLLAKQLFK